MIGAKSAFIVVIFASLLLLGCTQPPPKATTVPPTAAPTFAASPIVSATEASSKATVEPETEEETPGPIVTKLPAAVKPTTITPRIYNTTWVYVLTGYDKNFEDVVRIPSDYLVVDAFFVTPNTPFTNEQVQELKKNHKTVLAYVSIGEAEDYRYYWRWDVKEKLPAWVGKTNPNWHGNVKIKYWYPEWQAIVFEYIDRVVAQGFDGAYLDIVDGYEYWSDIDNGENEVLEKDEAATRMISFISEIRQRAQQKNPNFLIFPQNAPELVEYKGYLETIDGIGKEDTWYNGYSELQGSLAALPVQAGILNDQLKYLRQIRQAGKTVVVVDYLAPEQIAPASEFISKARAEGFIPYAADLRALNQISSFYVK